jgi:two-component system NtrC family sensor kinase
LVRRLSNAVEQCPVSVVITDPSGCITYANRKFLECTGYTYEEAFGQNPRILTSGRTTAEEYKHMWGSIKAGNEWRGEICNRKKNGELYWKYAVVRPIRDEKGHITHFLAIKEDITERRNMQAQLQRAQKLEAIGQLDAGIAHEINTPTQFIGDNTRFLQQAWTSLDELIAPLCAVPDSRIGEATLRQVVERLETADIPYLRKEVPSAIEQSLDGVEGVSKIVHAMKEFSHPGSEEKHLANINQAIETTLTVARQRMEACG